MDRWKRNSLQLLDNNRASQYIGRFFNIINNNNNNVSGSKTSPPSCPSPAWKLSDSFVCEEITPRRRKASSARPRQRPMSYNGPLFVEEEQKEKQNAVNKHPRKSNSSSAVVTRPNAGGRHRCVNTAKAAN